MIISTPLSSYKVSIRQIRYPTWPFSERLPLSRLRFESGLVQNGKMTLIRPNSTQSEVLIFNFSTNRVHPM